MELETFDSKVRLYKLKLKEVWVMIAEMGGGLAFGQLYKKGEAGDLGNCIKRMWLGIWAVV